MLLNQITKKKLQDFLSAMPEENLNVLIRGIEKSQLKGGEDPLTNMILLTARLNARAKEKKMPRLPGPLRLFAMPFEPFLVDNVVGPKQAARIDRASVLKVWHWLARDLIPDQLDRLSGQVKSAILAGDHEKARGLVNQLQVIAVKAIYKVLEGFEESPKEQDRIAGQLGGPQVLGDVIDIANILACGDDLLILRKRFSSQITGLQDEEIGWCLNQLEKFVERHPKMRPHGLALVMELMRHPSQIVRLAKFAAGSDDATKLAAHPYSVVIDLVLYDVRCKVDEICIQINEENNIDKLGTMISTYHDLMHYLQIEIEFVLKSDWCKTLTRLRAQLSERLSSKLIEAPRLIKAALKTGENSLELVSSDDVEEAENVLKLMKICMHVVDELALNELLSRIRRESEQFMTAMGDATVERLRRSDENNRASAQARADAAVRLTGIIFGDEISGLLRKAASIARRAAEEDTNIGLINTA